MEEDRDELERKCIKLTEDRDELADSLKNNYKKINLLDDKLARMKKYSTKLTKERDSLVEKNAAALSKITIFDSVYSNFVCHSIHQKFKHRIHRKSVQSA